MILKYVQLRIFNKLYINTLLINTVFFQVRLNYLKIQLDLAYFIQNIISKIIV